MSLPPSFGPRYDELMDSLMKVTANEGSILSFVDIYSNCYTIVLSPFAQKLYDDTKKIIENYLECKVESISSNLTQDHLSVLNEEWEKTYVVIKKFKDMLLCLDSNYSSRKELPMIYDLGVISFHNLILRNQTIELAMQKVVLKMIRDERNGQDIDRCAIKTAIDLLLIIDRATGLSVYDEIFETKFLEQSQLFYESEVQRLIEANNYFEYINQYETRVEEEQERINRYLHKRTERKILSLLENVMIRNKLNTLVDLKNGLDYLLINEKIEGINKIYQFYKKYDKINDFNNKVTECYHKASMSIMDRKNIPDPIKPIEELLELQGKYDKYVRDCFNNDEILKSKIKENYLEALNINEDCPEFLAAYIHSKITLASKNGECDEVTAQTENFVKIFRDLSNKDEFEKRYKKYLSKRLLSRKTNIEIEEIIIAKLKSDSGGMFTQNVVDMIMNIRSSDSHMDLFMKEILAKEEGAKLHNIDFSLYVLQGTCWPNFYQFPQVILPKSASAVLDLYRNFYDDKHNGRKITLQANMGTATVEATYDKIKTKKNAQLKKRSYLFEVTTLQMIVIMLFNENDQLSIDQIETKTNFIRDAVKVTLNSLVKCGILKNEINSEVFHINLEFFNKNYKYKVRNPKTSTETEEENKAIKVQVDRDRGMEIEAAAVRVMKTRKVLEHNNLITELISLLKVRFKPSVSMIEQKIKKLIEREYIKLQEGTTKTYEYVT